MTIGLFSQYPSQPEVSKKQEHIGSCFLSSSYRTVDTKPVEGIPK